MYIYILRPRDRDRLLRDCTKKIKVCGFGIKAIYAICYIYTACVFTGMLVCRNVCFKTMLHKEFYVHKANSWFRTAIYIYIK